MTVSTHVMTDALAPERLQKQVSLLEVSEVVAEHHGLEAEGQEDRDVDAGAHGFFNVCG